MGPSCSAGRAPRIRRAPIWCVHDAIRRDDAMTFACDRCSLIICSVRVCLCHQHPKYLRGAVHLGGWLLKEVEGDPSKTHVTFVASSDLKGSLPQVIKNKLALMQPRLVSVIKPLLSKR